MTIAAKRTLYELAGADADLRFSPHCWKIRMALAHKGLEAERLPWRFTEKEMIAFSGQGRVPVLVDNNETIFDSWRIALHLEERYPDHPSLFGTPAAIPLARFINHWADAELIVPIARIVFMNVHGLIDEKDKAYFRRTREDRFGKPLEDLVADRPARLAEFRQALQPLRLILEQSPFIAGEAPAYADYCVFGMFMWARCVGDVDVLEPSDPVYGWREKLLDAFDGTARRARVAQQRR